MPYVVNFFFQIERNYIIYNFAKRRKATYHDMPAPLLKRWFAESRDWYMQVTSVIHQNVAMKDSMAKPDEDPKFSEIFLTFA